MTIGYPLTFSNIRLAPQTTSPPSFPTQEGSCNEVPVIALETTPLKESCCVDIFKTSRDCINELVKRLLEGDVDFQDGAICKKEGDSWRVCRKWCEGETPEDLCDFKQSCQFVQRDEEISFFPKDPTKPIEEFGFYPICACNTNSK